MGHDHEALLRDAYAAFNSRDIEAVLGALHDDVDWPNAFEGGRVVGRDDVRDYWRRQFAQIDPRVERGASRTPATSASPSWSTSWCAPSTQACSPTARSRTCTHSVTA